MSALIQVNSDDQFTIVGKLNFTTIPALYKQGCKLIATSSKPIFNLGQITHSDNSGLTLLTSLLRYAKAQNKEVMFVKPTEQFFDLLQMSRLAEILPIINDNKTNG